MVYPSGVAYRSERGRDANAVHSKASASPNGPSEGFLLPGVIIDAAPPPPPPGVVAGAAGAGASAYVPLGALGAVIGGLGLGAWVKADIDAFKQKAKRPWYDTAYNYRPGSAWKSYVLPDNPQVFYDPEYDLRTKQRYEQLVEDYEEWFAVTGTPWWEGYGDVEDDINGYRAPVHVLSNMIRWFVFERCTNDTIEGWGGEASASCAGVAGWGVENGHPPTNTCVGLHSHSGAIPASPNNLFFCAANPNIASLTVQGMTAKDLLNRRRGVARWVLKTRANDVGLAPGLYPGGVGQPMPGAPVGVPFPRDLFPAPRPTPWRRAVAPPGTQPAGDNYPKERNRNVTLRAPVAFLDPAVVGRVRVRDQVIEVRPGVAPKPLPPGSPPPWSSVDGTAPEPDRNDRKLNVGTVGGRFLVAVNATTEVMDFIREVWRALPAHLRSKAKRRGAQVDPFTQAMDIYDHFGEVDLALAIENLVNNEIEDQMYGRFGRLSAKANQARHRGSGLSTAISRGLFASPHHDAMRPELPVPEIHFADALDGEGKVTISFE